MGIGAGYYFASAAASMLILVVLAILPMLEQKIDDFNQYRTYKVQCIYTETVKQHFKEVFRRSKLKYEMVNEVKEGDKMLLTWQAHGHVRQHEALADMLVKDALVERFEY